MGNHAGRLDAAASQVVGNDRSHAAGLAPSARDSPGHQDSPGAAAPGRDGAGSGRKLAAEPRSGYQKVGLKPEIGAFVLGQSRV